MERVISCGRIEETVKALCLKANTVLREDVRKALEEACRREPQGSMPRKMLEILLENARIAESTGIPICQDTGMAAVFIDIGRDVVVRDGNILEAVDMGIEKAYVEGLFRKSVVEDPILRKNTGTNTPAIIHCDLVEGDRISVSVMPKGFGSENKSRVAMLNPTCDIDEIAGFCVETVRMAGPDACPPYVLGVGIGGTVEASALLAKKALLRPITDKSGKSHMADLERKVFEQANALGIGVMGLGGLSTVIGVNVESMPTHIAGCPVTVNVCCHALRSATAVI